MRKIRVHLKLQSFLPEERKPHPASKCRKAKRLDNGSEHVIWTYDFTSNEKLRKFINHDKVCLMLPSQYENIDFTLVVQDLEDWDMILLENHDI
jgi:hypothetical protein